MSTPAKTLRRLQAEIKIIEKEPPEGIWIEYDEADLLQMKVLVRAPDDEFAEADNHFGSPYTGTFYKFEVDFRGVKYPFSPPKVKYVSSYGKRIHPNLYAQGKVCLSILGTWAGEPWSAAMGIVKIFQTIQTLVYRDPLVCEPGHTKDQKRKLDAYSSVKRWESFYQLSRMIVEERNERFRGIMRDWVKGHWEWYKAELMKLADVYDGKTLPSVFHGGGDVPQYAKLSEKMESELCDEKIEK